jgi:hypothetical protein
VQTMNSFETRVSFASSLRITVTLVRTLTLLALTVSGFNN